MKTLFTGLAFLLTMTSCCFSQLPTQYAYIDDSCTAVLDDYTGMVIARDNCDVPIITQLPSPGLEISSTTRVDIMATDYTGNSRSMSFDVVLIDTTPPTIQLNPDWEYTAQEMGDIYRTYYGWVQLNERTFIDSFQWDTLQYSAIVFDGVTQNKRTIFMNTIIIPDTVRREWWWAGGYDPIVQ